MKFGRDSNPGDQCYYCRRRCGGRDHSRFAHWVPALQGHIEVSAHTSCFYDADFDRLPCNADFSGAVPDCVPDEWVE